MALKFRAIDRERKPKYQGLPGHRPRLYNVLDLSLDSSVLGVCEGEVAAAVLSKMVGIPAVGYPGVGSWQPYWRLIFEDYEEVLIFPDNDLKEDGSNPGMKAAYDLRQTIKHSRLVQVPEGHDLDSWYLRDGKEAILKAVHG